jgi:uncharacterized protein YdeI (YjbR/CyaY-like superfamily)
VAEPRFFRSGTELRRWLERNHDRKTELWIGFYKKASGKRGITYEEALDQALCFGWIDGKVNTIDGERYKQRFSPRRPGSNWSSKNLRRVEELKAEGLMAPPGLAAFDNRDPARSGVQLPEALDPALERRFRKDRPAWRFWEAQPAGYRRVATWWVMSAKREETRIRRLDKLMAACGEGTRLPQLGG